ncbi:hypothetical protein D1007_35761 [Hordeum vulgare]|nr:hypothetical protein D1007_35761 [Hordeum vulgare]
MERDNGRCPSLASPPTAGDARALVGGTYSASPVPSPHPSPSQATQWGAGERGMSVASARTTSTSSVSVVTLPLQGTVEARLPGAESIPAPQDGEVVVFSKHFVRSLGLPVSTFFQRFLTRFGLQPHRLGANSILQLFAFLAFCEGYLGIEPLLDLSCRLFYFKKQTTEDKARERKEMTACGATLVYV